MTPTLKSIRRRAANNTLEVEHILKAAAERLEGLPGLLAELGTAEDWSDTNHLPDGTHVVPLSRWARVASVYCLNGYPGLKELLGVPGHEPFVLALLEELHSPEAVRALIDFFSEQIKSPGDDPPLAHMIGSSLNQILCSKQDVEIDATAKEKIRAFASELIELSSDQVERAVPVLLLRAVGDESSLRLIDNLPPFTEHWAATVPATKRAILKRIQKMKG
jgi:hypothetical protein